MKGAFVQRLGLIVATVVVVMAGCHAADEALAPRAIDGVSIHRTQMDCVGSWDTCSAILGAINYLKNHADSPCRNLGAAAENRFNSMETDVGFREESHPEALMGVAMYYSGSGTTTSHWSATNGVTEVYPGFHNSAEGQSSDPAWAAGIVAHEEGGHHTGGDDPDHNTGVAAMFESMCGQEN